jgi:RNA polymerase sigma-70 factor (ECF subfamily)
LALILSLTSLYDEKDLLRRIAAGDEEAFAILFRKFHPKVYQVGSMLMRSHELSEELVQDIFLKIWLKREQLITINDFESYLFIIARNESYHTLQRQLREQRLMMAASQTTPSYSNDTEDRILDNNYKQLLHEAMGRLPPKQQEVYRLSKVEGLKRDEIAARLGIQPETVKDHLAKGARTIRAYFVAHSHLLPPGSLLVITLWLELLVQ